MKQYNRDREYTGRYITIQVEVDLRDREEVETIVLGLSYVCNLNELIYLNIFHFIFTERVDNVLNVVF